MEQELILSDKELLGRLKTAITSIQSNLEVLVYGPFIHNKPNPENELHLIILLDKEKISLKKELEISKPLFDLGIYHGFLIRPLFLSKKSWERISKEQPELYNIKKGALVI
ncbi:hypothetical protein [Persicobacter sp. CCB-QB2]|uniref:hypothetical protein n=1 Tax=Persicobacter sp. CCB-QB2 TaxID=1561025 RepID=UPI0006A9DA99|nr:hypothetical protein [Persicobacter sp. CCB-QB2]